VTFRDAVDYIIDLVREGHGGYVVTPNVDHIVLAESDEGLRLAYADASLSLADGMPLIWMAKLLRTRIPEKVSGSDIMLPLIERAAHDGLRVYFLGGAPGVAQAASATLLTQLPTLQICGHDAPPLGFEREPEVLQKVIDTAKAAKPHIIFVALGCPKQELFMRMVRRDLAPAVLLGIGASLDFIAGAQIRAPGLVRALAAEWLWRLIRDPRRLAARYGACLAILPGLLLRALQVRRGAGAKPTERSGA
jgi:N-acetylglucosaminyldiphosphoundecaprenol N-acetyl-beta-D-mannosaminyltransferase